MPKRILLLGIIFCFFGAAGIYEIITQALAGRVYLALNVLMLPVGIGLLRGKESARGFARWWIIFTGVLLIIASIFALANAALIFFLACAIFLGINYLFIRLLDSEEATAFFHQKTLEERRRTLYPERGTEA